MQRAPSIQNSKPGILSAILGANAQRPLSRGAVIASWLLQILSAVILAQTLFFKFTAAEEPVYIFTKLGAEPWGRIGSGVFELIAAVLLLIPRLSLIGAVLGAGVMVGAIGAHLGPLGIVVKDDGGLLFALGLIVFIACLAILVLRRNQLRAIAADLGLLKVANPAQASAGR